MKNELFAIIRGKGVTKGERWGKGWGGGGRKLYLTTPPLISQKLKLL